MDGNALEQVGFDRSMLITLPARFRWVLLRRGLAGALVMALW